MAANPTLSDARLLLEAAQKILDLTLERASVITEGGKRIDDHQVLAERVAYAVTEGRAARAALDFATALAQALVPVIALVIWKPQVTSVEALLGVLGLNAFFVILFVGSALLFRRASVSNPT
ncbi:MAG: hypothetical protein IH827_12345 [Myxococcales bacterium]|nr:hypothetical protein [Myxococcales bacterium]